MILLADSGSTKTHWWLAGNGKFAGSLQTPGLNPYFHTREGMGDLLGSLLGPWISDREVQAVYFYGSGCSTAVNKQMIIDSLRPLLRGDPSVHVEKDILGAARALFGGDSGIASILGTGSNACIYDGTGITHEPPSLGYIFGDEGSGAHLGKTLINLLLKDRLPAGLRKAFHQEFSLDRAAILERVYRQEHPNRFLASFTVFLHGRMNHPFIQKLVEECMESFFTQILCKLPEYKSLQMGCIGSVGYHFRDVVRRIAEKHGVQCGKFLVSPMEGLLNYHSKS
jgi:glucosamine kinase